MYSLLRPLLFRLEAERAHSVALSALHLTPSCCFSKPAINKVKVFGIEFEHPIGLAAGFDKNASHLKALSKIGFSHIEVGTVTPRPQVGNPQPRLFRVPELNAIVNRMGFNNNGVDALVKNIKRAGFKGILGVNIGKNSDTLLSKAAEDYVHCMRAVYAYASYITINISSPNTPDLRQLQEGQYFSFLLEQLKNEQKALEDQHQRRVPLVIKISPDEDEENLKAMAGHMLALGVEGIIATNTTAQRDYFESLPQIMRQGGMSGKPLTSLATRSLQLLKKYVGDEIVLIGVGGIHDSASAQEKIDAGAQLIQVYTGLIYKGPGLVSELAENLLLPIQNKP